MTSYRGQLQNPHNGNHLVFGMANGSDKDCWTTSKTNWEQVETSVEPDLLCGTFSYIPSLLELQVAYGNS